MLGTLEMSLQDLEEMQKDAQNEGIQLIFLNYGSQMLVSYFATSWTKAARDLAAEADARVWAANMMWQLGRGPNPADAVARNQQAGKVKGSMAGFTSRISSNYRITKRAFYNMYHRPFAHISFHGGVRQAFGPRNTFRMLKTHLYNKFIYPLVNIRKGFTSLMKGQFNPFRISNYQFSWSSALSFSITVSDVIV